MSAGPSPAAQRNGLPMKQPDRFWANQIRHRFKLSVEDWVAMYEQQGGVCAICGEPSETRRLAVDHDRKCCPGRNSCGKCVRALLCTGCNVGLGWYERNMNVVDGYVGNDLARQRDAAVAAANESSRRVSELLRTIEAIHDHHAAPDSLGDSWR